jgi:hypothetical protein
MLTELFGTAKPVIAMAHLAPLPGSARYDARAGMQAILDGVATDVERLQAGGVDAIMVGNEGDRPYVLKAPPEGLAAMSAIVAALRPSLRVPFGVDYLWDPVATVALAVATGARFAREVFTGVYDSDMGLWQPDCAGALRLRHGLGRDDLRLLFNVNAEFAAPLGERAIERKAESAVFSALADAICVSGPMTGQAVDASDLERVKRRLTSIPVLANTGVTIDNVASILKVADGCVIGTHFKKDGITWNPVDGDRVKRFMDRARSSR